MPASMVRKRKREPVWDLAEMFPYQGDWTEEEYFELETKRRCEFDNGFIELLPMPFTSHQIYLLFLYQKMLDVLEHGIGGLVLTSGTRIRLWPKKYREPDIAYMAAGNMHRVHEEYWDGADLVVEIVSPGTKNRERDLRAKRLDYAKANIPEYWIVDPLKSTLTVFTLRKNKYAVHGRFTPRDEATSAKWPGLRVKVADVFRAAKRR